MQNMMTISNVRHMGMHMDSLLQRMQIFDSVFPIGAYTMSNGLESYVQQGIIHDRVTLQEYLYALLTVLPYNDLGFAAKAAMGESFVLLDTLCTASRSAYELREGCRKLCIRFLKMILEMEQAPKLTVYQNAIAGGQCFGSYPVAIGLYLGKKEIEQGLAMYCYQQLSAAVTHAVKLVPLRQSDGQIALHEILTQIPMAVQAAMRCSLDELGAGGFGFSLRAMQHEVLYSRLYLS